MFSCQSDSGDDYLVSNNQRGVLIAVVDGVGHGTEAAQATKVATSVLRTNVDTPIDRLVARCHEELQQTRGVVLSVACIDAARGSMAWLGVGNVQGVLTRSNAAAGNHQETLLLRGGVVGSRLPPLRPAALPLTPGDTVYLATDGIRNTFADSLSPLENPQKAADRILQHFCDGGDDALVLVARLTGVRA